MASAFDPSMPHYADHAFDGVLTRRVLAFLIDYAIVAVLLTRGRPWPLFFITLLFGVVDSLSFRVQGLGMPQQFTDMMPYLATLAVLTAISWWYRKSRT